MIRSRTLFATVTLAAAAILISALGLGCDDGDGTATLDASTEVDTTADTGRVDTAEPDTGGTGADLIVIASDVEEVDTAPEVDVEVVDPIDLYAPLYDPEHVLEIDLRLGTADWDALRNQARDILDVLGEGCLDSPANNPYSWFRGEATIDGEAVPEVAFRKKGFLGSQSTTKPSIKLDFDRYVDDRRVFGLERMALNNVRQDPSYLNTCLGYALLRDAGVPAPRCNFARVSMNGVELGLYVHIQEVRDNFLIEHFGDAEGAMLEGALSDFRTGWMGSFEEDGGDEVAGRAAIDAVRQVVENTPDPTLLDELDALIDLDAFLTFWAMEVLIGHWDGYAGNTNNYFVYLDPADGRLDFLPWGADALFQEPLERGFPASVMAQGALSERLYLHPEGRARYEARLTELLDAVWDEARWTAEVDRMEALVAANAAPDELADVAAGADRIRAYIAARRAAVTAELGGPSVWDQELRDAPCLEPIGTVDWSFDSGWNNLDAPNPFITNTGTIHTLTVDGIDLPHSTVGARTGPYTTDDGVERRAVQLLAITDPDHILYLGLDLAPEQLTAGPTPIEFDFGRASATLARFESATGAVEVLGYIVGEGVVFDTADQVAGGRIIGRVTGELYRF